MKYYPKALLVVISYWILFFFPSQSFASDSDLEKLDGVLSTKNEKILYKVDIDAMKNHFSGLLLIKKGSENETFHIVFLSEVGLNLCEFLSDGKSMKLVQASSIFQSKSAQKILAEDFSMLIHPMIIKTHKKNRIKTQSDIIVYTNNDGTVLKMKKRRLINGIRMFLTDYENSVPKNIAIKHVGINFKLKLSLLKVN